MQKNDEYYDEKNDENNNKNNDESDDDEYDSDNESTICLPSKSINTECDDDDRLLEGINKITGIQTQILHRDSMPLPPPKSNGIIKI